MKSKDSTNILDSYDKLGTMERRTVNKLARALATGNVDRPALQRISRSIHRNAASRVQPDKPPRTSGYITFYKEAYALHKKETPTDSLGQIAKAVGLKWKSMSVTDREQYNKLSKSV
jgi:hypothetical protein